MSDAPSTSLYLKPGRLSDILALVQVLAYGELAKQTHAGLMSHLRRIPLTADTWTDIGRQHPELFRVLEAEDHASKQETVALISRLFQPALHAEASDVPPKSMPLTPDVTSKLIEFAIELYDREVQRRDRWKSVMVPMIVAIVAAGASVTSAVIVSMKQTAQPTHAAPTGSSASTLAPNPTVDPDARKSGARGSP